MKEHKIYENGNKKTVCVSACLSFFDIQPTEYRYTYTKNNSFAWVNVLRRKYSVRSRMSEFKITKNDTMTTLRNSMKKSRYGVNDFFIVSGYQKTTAHLMVLNGNGETVIDTAKGMRWKIRKVMIVTKK